MNIVKGPAVFLAQSLEGKKPLNSLKNICAWTAELGYKGFQIPLRDDRCFDLKKGTESKTYTDEIKGVVNGGGMEVTELSTHLPGQLVPVHPAYDTMFDVFAPKVFHSNPSGRQAWAMGQLEMTAKTSQNLGLKVHDSFSGVLVSPFMYPWSQRLPGLVEQGLAELAKRWIPILNIFDKHGVDLCDEIQADEDFHDSIAFERFYEAT